MGGYSCGRRKIGKKRTVMVGMLMGVKTGIKIEKQEIKGMEEIMELVVRLEEERWKIIGVYVKGNLNRKGPRRISM